MFRSQTEPILKTARRKVQKSEARASELRIPAKIDQPPRENGEILGAKLFSTFFGVTPQMSHPLCYDLTKTMKTEARITLRNADGTTRNKPVWQKYHRQKYESMNSVARFLRLTETVLPSLKDVSKQFKAIQRNSKEKS